MSERPSLARPTMRLFALLTYRAIVFWIGVAIGCAVPAVAIGTSPPNELISQLPEVLDFAQAYTTFMGPLFLEGFIASLLFGVLLQFGGIGGALWRIQVRWFLVGGLASGIAWTLIHLLRHEIMFP